VMAHELKLERNLNKSAIERKDSEITSLSIALQQKIDENAILKNELKKSRSSSPELKPLIERWRGQSKPTRDWTKANQLLEELNNLIS